MATPTLEIFVLRGPGPRQPKRSPKALDRTWAKGCCFWTQLCPGFVLDIVSELGRLGNSPLFRDISDHWWLEATLFMNWAPE